MSVQWVVIYFNADSLLQGIWFIADFNYCGVFIIAGHCRFILQNLPQNYREQFSWVKISWFLPVHSRPPAAISAQRHISAILFLKWHTNCKVTKLPQNSLAMAGHCQSGARTDTVFKVIRSSTSAMCTCTASSSMHD